ncbi:hypothetical protein ASC94_09575 [Massilia sp. Root418]|nr:hypothetical protein ASC94_09575 [Massilia sp. Root418]
MAAVLASLLTACGGGGGGPSGGCVTLDAGRDPALPSCGGTTSSTPSTASTLAMALTDASGAAITAISQQRSGTLVLTLKDARGVAVPNVTITVTTTDKTAVLSPAAGSALTDASGVAKIGLNAGTQAGAFTATATAVLGTASLTAQISYAVSAPASMVALTLTDAAGAATSAISPERSGTLNATVRDNAGVPQQNVAVTFTSSDKTAVMDPPSGTALTNASGVAKVGLLAGTQAGAYTAQAAANLGSVPSSASLNYSVAFKVLTLSSMSMTPSTLSAGGNASITVTVLSDGTPYQPVLPVTFTSPCVSAGKAAIGSPVLTQNGVATASYSDRGCGVADVITASVALGGTTVTKTGILTVLPAAAGSLKFINANSTNISLKGTGGFGRQEFSTLTFQVMDVTGNPVSGKQIDFLFADTTRTDTVGGLTLSPSSATSAADGTVTTLVTAGTIPTSVRVVATVRGTTLTTLSNILVISTGVPDQAHISLSSSTGNCEGRDFDQHCTFITVALGDHFGNPAPDGTAVNFTTNSGTIGASCVTGSLPPPGATPDNVVPGVSPGTSQTTNSRVGPGSGTCTVELRSGAPRNPNGKVVVLAYALGEETLFDANGNNVYDNGDSFTDLSPDIYRDDDENHAWSPGERCIGPNTNSRCSSPGDGVYNGVLRSPATFSPQVQYISAQLGEIFSGSNANIVFSPAAPECNANLTADIMVTVKDVVGNIMPAGTVVSMTALFGASGAPASPSTIKIPNVVRPVGGNIIPPSYLITVGCPTQTSKGKLTVTVVTPGGTTSIGNITIN